MWRHDLPWQRPIGNERDRGCPMTIERGNSRGPWRGWTSRRGGDRRPRLPSAPRPALCPLRDGDHGGLDLEHRPRVHRAHVSPGRGACPRLPGRLARLLPADGGAIWRNPRQDGHKTTGGHGRRITHHSPGSARAHRPADRGWAPLLPGRRGLRLELAASQRLGDRVAQTLVLHPLPPTVDDPLPKYGTGTVS